LKNFEAFETMDEEELRALFQVNIPTDDIGICKGYIENGNYVFVCNSTSEHIDDKVIDDKVTALITIACLSKYGRAMKFKEIL